MVASCLPGVLGDPEARLRQMLGHLRALGMAADLLTLLPPARELPGEEELEEALSLCRRVEARRRISGPARFLSSVADSIRGLLGKRTSGGRERSAPLRRGLCRGDGPAGYRAVLVMDSALAAAAGWTRRGTARILDLPDLESLRGGPGEIAAPGSISGRSARRHGGLDCLRRFDRILAACGDDARWLRSARYGERVALVPFAAGIHGEHPASRSRQEPIRPPRILLVVSESPADIDGVRFFRRRILPRIRARIPSVRLRLVGSGARRLQPGPDIEIAASPAAMEREYRAAALVALPLRDGARVRSAAVAALAAGKALVATPAGVYGLELTPGRDALVAEAPDTIAEAAAGILASDAIRRRLEDRAALVARRTLDPAAARRSLEEILGLDLARRRAAGAESVLGIR